jgi:hypothetical protein
MDLLPTCQQIIAQLRADKLYLNEKNIMAIYSDSILIKCNIDFILPYFK